MMLGIEDPQIWLGYLLSIGFALWCMAYGLVNWNRKEGQDGR